MKKVYQLEDLDCANCALKMEKLIADIKGVESASVSFLTQKLTIEAPENEFPRIMKEAAKLIRRVEPDCRILL